LIRLHSFHPSVLKYVILVRQAVKKLRRSPDKMNRLATLQKNPSSRETRLRGAQQGGYPRDIDRALQVITQHVQGKLGFRLLQPAHRKTRSPRHPQNLSAQIRKFHEVLTRTA